MRQDSEYHASLGYTVSSRPTKATKGSYYHKLINTTPTHTTHVRSLILSFCLSLSLMTTALQTGLHTSQDHNTHLICSLHPLRRLPTLSPILY